MIQGTVGVHCAGIHILYTYNTWICMHTDVHTHTVGVFAP